jgi:hypothetical protein
VNDDPVLRALADLPRLEASPGFTTRVVARAAAPAPAAGRARVLRLATAAALVLAVILAAGLPAWRQARLRGEQRARVEALQQERRALERELQALRRLAAEHSSVVYLGGDESVDLVLDLESLAGRAPQAAVPAGYTVKP